MFGNKSHCVNNLRLFGEMGVVTTKEKIQGKLKDRGTVCMFVGYPPSHACDVYRMLNMSTRHVIKSRDIKWLHKTYEDWCVKEDPESEKDDEIDDDDSILANTKAQETVEQDKKKDKGSKVIREMKKLQGWFNPDASRVVESSNSGREPIVDQADIAFMMMEQPKEPGTFNEAFNHPEEDVRLKWREAIH